MLNKKEKMSLVEIDIDTPCEFSAVQKLLGVDVPRCTNRATVGYLGHASGQLGRCYCSEHDPRKTECSER